MPCVATAVTFKSLYIPTSVDPCDGHLFAVRAAFTCSNDQGAGCQLWFKWDMDALEGDCTITHIDSGGCTLLGNCGCGSTSSQLVACIDPSPGIWGWDPWGFGRNFRIKVEFYASESDCGNGLGKLDEYTNYFHRDGTTHEWSTINNPCP